MCGDKVLIKNPLLIPLGFHMYFHPPSEDGRSISFEPHGEVDRKHRCLRPGGGLHLATTMSVDFLAWIVYKLW